jgi:hypothetical protein
MHDTEKAGRVWDLENMPHEVRPRYNFQLLLGRPTLIWLNFGLRRGPLWCCFHVGKSQPSKFTQLDLWTFWSELFFCSEGLPKGGCMCKAIASALKELFRLKLIPFDFVLTPFLAIG